MEILEYLLSLLVPTTILLHLWIAPYTKVEESFNLQAAHDIIRYGVPKITSAEAVETLRLEYDHFSFPGAVPRTFVGSLVLAGFSKPFIALLGNRLNEQLIVRGVLGLFNALAILSFRRAAAKGYGRGTANWYLLLQCSQFHVIYYASRTLPNIFAFGLSIIGFQQFLPMPLSELRRRSASHRLGIYILTVTAVVFRSELALYLAIQVLYLLSRGRLSLAREVIVAGIAGAIVGLTTTLIIDSFFWQSYSSSNGQPPIFSTPFLTSKFGLIWPEFTAFYFNTVLNKAGLWGTSPWHTYFTSSLPKLLINPLAFPVLLPMSVALPGLKKGALDILIPALGFVSLYSFMPHKEWRFIMYVVPGITLVTGMSANWVWNRRSKSVIYFLLSIALVTSVFISFLVSTGMLLISSLNYPGGEALNDLHGLVRPSPGYRYSGHVSTLSDSPSTGFPTMKNITIHLDVPICMTGATRFLQDKPLLFTPTTKPKNWIIDKTEDVDTLKHLWFWEKIDYTLSSRRPENVPGKWEALDVIKGYKGVKILKPGEKTGEAFHRRLKLVTWLEIGKWWAKLEAKVRYRYMRGWWVDVKMEPKVWILKRTSNLGGVRNMGWE